MKHWRRTFLSEQEEKEVELRVADFEKKTGSEIKIAVMRESSVYRSTRWQFTALFSIAVTYLLYLEFSWTHDATILLLFQVASVFSVFYATTWKPFQKLILPAGIISIAVKERALAMFYRLSVHESAHRSSALLYVSLFERRFELLLDKNLNEQFEKEELETLTAHMRDHFKSRHFESGLMECITVFENKLIEKKLTHDRNPKEVRDSIFWGRSS